MWASPVPHFNFYNGGGGVQATHGCEIITFKCDSHDEGVEADTLGGISRMIAHFYDHSLGNVTDAVISTFLLLGLWLSESQYLLLANALTLSKGPLNYDIKVLEMDYVLKGILCEVPFFWWIGSSLIWHCSGHGIM